MSHKILWSYLLGSQSLDSVEEVSAEDVTNSLGNGENDVDLVLSVVRAKLEAIQSGRETVNQLIDFVDQVAESRGGEMLCDGEMPEELLIEVAHMRALLNQPSLGMAA